MHETEPVREPSSPRSSGPRWIAMLGGVALGLIYAALELRLPRGPAEFAFWPALEPLPFAAIRGVPYEQLVRFAGRLGLLGPGLLLIGWGLAGLTRRLPKPKPASLALAAGAAGLGVATWLLFATLDGRALVDDELSYAWQAELLTQGRFTEDRLPRWAPEPFTVWTARGATGKYLFGEPLVQVPGVLVGYPALLHLPLLAFLLWLWFDLVAATTGRRDVAAWATALLALSPAVLLVTATGLAHVSSLAAMVALGWGTANALRDRPWVGGLFAGMALGFGLAVRAQVALPFGAPLVAWLLLGAWRRRQPSAALALVLGAAPWVLAIAAYNLYLTGSVWSLPWSLYSPTESFGFGNVLEGSDYRHTPLRALENLLVVGVRLNAFLLGWPASLGLLLLWWKVGRPAAGAARWLLAGAGLTVFNLGYFSPGISGFGALYHLELILPFAFLGAQAIVVSLERWPRLTASLLAVHLVLGTGGFLVEQGTRIARMANLVHAAPQEALATLEAPALLLYESWPSEAIVLGWITGGWPTRTRADAAPVITYPRSSPQTLDALRRLYPERACWYYRIEPSSLQPDLRLCDDVDHLLDRPFVLPGRRLAIRSTAMLKGLVPPPEG